MIDALPPPDPPAVIIVTGEKLPEPSSERAYAVELIERDDLLAAPGHQLDQALRQVAGIQLFRRSDSTSGHPTSQGVTLRSLGGNAASRALLVLDGVPQSDPFGGWINWPAYDPESLRQVRVLRGGGSVIHGPGSIAGIIELSSFAEEGANATVEAGSRQSLAGRSYVGIGAGPGRFTINVRGLRSEGFIPVTSGSRGLADRPAPYVQASARARWLTPLNAHTELQASGLAFVDDRERGLDFTGNRTRGADLSLRLVGSGGWQWTTTAYAQWREFRSSFASLGEARSRAERVALQDAVPSSGFGAAFELRPPMGKGTALRIGGDLRLTEGESRELYAFVAGNPTRRRVAGGKSASGGLFADLAWSRSALLLNGGIRLDYWEIRDGRLSERLIAGGAPTRDDDHAGRQGWRPTARAAALLDIGSGFAVRSAAYLGWRVPTLNELFRPFRAGADATAANPLLDPERLSGFELGIHYRSSGLDLRATAFANRLSGAIGNVTLGQGPGTFPGVGFVAGSYRERRNLDAVVVQGIEASAEARHGHWSLRLSASYNAAEVRARKTARDLDGLRPAQTPKFSLSSGLTWQDGERVASLMASHVGHQYEDDLNRRRLPAATTLDGYFAWPVSRRTQLIARGENLLNETVVAGIGADGAVERATPRTIWVGLRSQFQ